MKDGKDAFPYSGLQRTEIFRRPLEIMHSARNRTPTDPRYETAHTVLAQDSNSVHSPQSTVHSSSYKQHVQKRQLSHKRVVMIKMISHTIVVLVKRTCHDKIV